MSDMPQDTNYFSNGLNLYSVRNLFQNEENQFDLLKYLTFLKLIYTQFKNQLSNFVLPKFENTVSDPERMDKNVQDRDKLVGQVLQTILTNINLSVAFINKGLSPKGDYAKFNLEDLVNLKLYIENLINVFNSKSFESYPEAIQIANLIGDFNPSNTTEVRNLYEKVAFLSDEVSVRINQV